MASFRRMIAICGVALCLAAECGAAGFSEVPPHASAPLLVSGETLALQTVALVRPGEQYRARNWIRQRVVRKSDLASYGLRLNDEWEGAAAHRPVVVLLHGFNSTPEQNAAILKPIHARQFACGTFAYPNDHTIESSARLLSAELKKFARRYPARRVALVCHSMGSLVARACLEVPSLDPGNVDRLIMIAPPTHGTVLAKFAVGTDIYEHWLARRGGGPWRRMRDSIVDGLGEAGCDLCPNSIFLMRLNSLPRNPQIRYSILLGTGGCMSDAQVQWVRESFCDALAKVPGGEPGAERLAGMLEDIDELVEGRGDGIVAVKRGRLDGVADTLVLPFGHMAVTGEPDSDVLCEVQRAVLERVQ